MDDSWRSCGSSLFRKEGRDRDPPTLAFASIQYESVVSMFKYLLVLKMSKGLCSKMEKKQVGQDGQGNMKLKS